MNVIETNIPEVKIIEPRVFGDERGYFMETWQQKTFEDLVAERFFVQDNHSKSSKGILRGLHYQTENAQGKLVRVISGEVFDVAVDMRKKSKTFGQWVGVVLSSENKRQLWIPEGFAHGYQTLEDDTEVFYHVSEFYTPTAERGFRYNDQYFAINWPLEVQVISDKDRNWPDYTL